MKCIIGVGFWIFATLLFAEPQDPEELTRSALARQLSYIRVLLVASDEELPHIREAVEEAEHALEPPMHEIEGGFAKRFMLRRWDMLKSIPLAVADSVTQKQWTVPPPLDLRRSFQNIRRLIHLSSGFESPWLRNLMLNSSAMFALTHGGEFVTGSLYGTKHLMMGDMAGAVAWYGLAIPGLYDVGCWIGQGLILVRPSREIFNVARRTVWYVGGAAAQKLGADGVLRAVLQMKDARDRLFEAVKTQKSGLVLDLEIPDETLLKLNMMTPEQRRAMRLVFEERPDGSLMLREAEIEKEILRHLPYRELKAATKDLGWNLLGALRQIQKLAKTGNESLIAHEKTFVTDVHESESLLSITFREEAVRITAAKVLRGTTSVRQVANRVCGFFASLAP